MAEGLLERAVQHGGTNVEEKLPAAGFCVRWARADRIHRMASKCAASCGQARPEKASAKCPDHTLRYPTSPLLHPCHRTNAASMPTMQLAKGAQVVLDKHRSRSNPQNLINPVHHLRSVRDADAGYAHAPQLLVDLVFFFHIQMRRALIEEQDLRPLVERAC